MCRMIGIFSKNPKNPSRFFCESEKSLLNQSDALKGRFQKDGWGIACYANNGKPLVYKSSGFAADEKDIFRKRARLAESKIAIAHIRAASNPQKLPKKEIIGKNNNQPFCFENFIFAHNGTLSICENIKKRLGRYSKFIKSNNDSEVLFWQIIKMLNAYGSIEEALEAAIDEIETVWISVKGESEFNYPYKGLNILFSDGKALYSVRRAVHLPQKNALMTKNWKFWDMAFKKTDDAAIFSSEPASGGLWQKIHSSSIAKTFLKNGKIITKTSQLQRAL